MKAYVFDLDGTLYRGETAIPGASAVLSELRRRGSKVLFLTNNSGQTSAAFVAKLERLGFEAHVDEVYGTGKGAAIFLEDQQIRSAFVVGEKGLADSLMERGIVVTNLDSNGVPGADGEPADAVVSGICRHFSYGYLASAMRLIRGGAAFIATNRDSTYPMEGGIVVPGSGSIVAAIETCAEVTPFTIGKPNPFLLQLAMREWNLVPESTLVVGDRLDTDIACGINAGCHTHLVLTGVSIDPPAEQRFSEDLSALLV